VCVNYVNVRKQNVPERLSGLRPNEKEISQRRSVTKIHLDLWYFEFKVTNIQN
jgi:hypothetical protein